MHGTPYTGARSGSAAARISRSCCLSRWSRRMCRSWCSLVWVASVLCYLRYGFNAGLFTAPALLRVAIGGYLAAFLFAAVTDIAQHAFERVFAVLALTALLLALLRYTSMRDARGVAA